MIVKRLIMLVLLIVVFLVSACGTDSLLKKEYKDTKREQYIDTGYPTRKNGSNENFILSLRNKKSSSPNHSNGIYDEKGHFIKKGILKNQS